jgi:hypothetical protein
LGNIGFQLEPASDASDTPMQEASLPAAEQDSASGSGGGSWVPVIAGGALAVVGLGVGAGFHFAAVADRDDHDATVERIGPGACGVPNEPAECAELANLSESSDSKRNLSTVGFVAGGAAAVGTIVYFLVTRPDRDSSARALRVNATASTNGGSFLLSGTF